MENQKGTPIASPTVGRAISSYQAGFPDQAFPAGDDFVRGNLDGDVLLPKGTFCDPLVVHWEGHTEPRLSYAHDSVGRALANFFPSTGGWVYLTQEMIAAEADASRQVTNRCLQDLIDVGRVERRDMRTQQGHRGHAYRMTGEDTGWEPSVLGIDGRTTVAGFKKELERFAFVDAVETALQAVMELVPADRQMPDSALTLLEVIRSPGKDAQSEFLERMEKLNNDNNNGSLSCKEGYSAVTPPAHMTQEPLTEKQLITIFGHQERTALSVEDIWASWPDIYHGTEPSESLEVLSKSHAFRLVAWLKKQPDAPVVEVEVGVPCTCDAMAVGMLDAEAEPSAQAQAMWATALEALAEELPRTTFETWLEATEGVRCEGEILVVKVSSLFTIAWLEQRMYQTILRAVRGSSGPGWDVRFDAGVAGSCRRHGTVEAAG